MSKNIRNFKGYNQSGGYNTNNYNSNKSQNGAGSTCKNANKSDIENDVKNQFDKYSSYSENQLIEEFYKEVHKQQKLGNLSPQMLQNFYNSMAPNMTPEQRRKMKNLIDSVK